MNTYPQTLGPYTGFTPHAQGGLGEVLQATDSTLHRTVAIKRLQPTHAGNPASQRRFLLEAEITARLEHPGVVPVYSLLRDDAAQPCYAMRFIEGQTFADAIRSYHAAPANPLGFRRLLQSFVQICQTVAYAHSRGVIHRDLKPANVMLGKFGETLVVDWGLAKVVGRPEEIRDFSPEETLQPSDRTMGEETAFGAAVGTPAYMSPEQAAGRWDVVHAASDIYSLGAVLYQLLTGQAPLTKGNWPELSQRIQRGDIPAPRQVKASIPRALEAVCQKAMALDATDRYASAQALAADVERWLADEPVTASPEGICTRASRWLRRHRLFVSGAAILLVTTLAAAAAGLFLLDRKNQEVAAERNGARKAADQAEAINRFLMEDLLGQADPDVNDRSKKITVEELLAKAARKIEGNPNFKDQPEVEATLRLTIGKTFFRLGNFAEAEKHLQRAVQLSQAALGAEHPRTLAMQEALADFLNRGPGRYHEAEDLAKRTWEARGRVLGSSHRDTLDSLDTYATALYLAGRVVEAGGRHEECLASRRRALGDEDPDTLVSMNNLALALLEQGKWSEASRLLREALERLGHHGQGSGHAMCVSNLAMALYMNGDLEEAESLLTENVARTTKQFGADHPLTNRSHGLLFCVWLEQGRLEEGVALGEEVVARRRRLYPGNHWLTANALVEWGRGLALLGRHAEAEEALSEALRIYHSRERSRPQSIAWAQCWKGVSLAGLGRAEEAEPLLVAAERTLRDHAAAPWRHREQALQQLAWFYEGW